MKWNLFICATALAAWLLLSHGAPIIAVICGTVAAGAFAFLRRQKA